MEGFVIFAGLILLVWFLISAKKHGAKIREAGYTIAAERAIADGRLAVLARKKQAGIVVDSWGAIDSRKWDKDFREFYIRFVDRSFVKNQHDATMILQIILARVDAYIAANFQNGYSDDFSGVEYEKFVADQFRATGWSVTTTPATGDHGVDLVATKASRVVAIQCKHFTKPVGNAAVQEIAAGRVHYMASEAAVIAPNDFTRGARSLAASNGVRLMHHDEIAGL